MDTGPRCRSQNHDCDRPIFEILLIAEILVCSYKNVEAMFFGPGQQITISKCLPAEFECGFDTTYVQIATKRYGSTLVKEDLHAALRSFNVDNS